MSYTHDKDGRRLSQDERIARYQRQRPKAKPGRPPLSRNQYEAEQQGRDEAKRKAAPPPEPNPYRRALKNMKGQTPAERRQRERHEEWADEWDEQHAEQMAREAAREKLTSTPGYWNAISHSNSFLKTIEAEHAEAAHTARGYLEESGDYQGYWAKVVEIESAIVKAEDAKARELATKASAATTEFTEQVSKRDEATKRRQTAEANQE